MKGRKDMGFLRRHWWAVAYGALLCAFTAYVAADTFLIPKVYAAAPLGAEAAYAQSGESKSLNSENASDVAETDNSGEAAAIHDAEGAEAGNASSSRRGRGQSGAGAGTGASEDTESNADESSSNANKRSGANPDASGSDTTTSSSDATASISAAAAPSALGGTLIDSYDDGSIAITVSEHRVHDTSVYLADIAVTSPDLLKTALAQGVYGRNVTDVTSNIAAQVGAVLAINGDFYGAQEHGYVLRGGVLYRNASAGDKEDLVIYADGSWGVVNEAAVSAEELLADGAREVLSFGPALVLDGAVSVSAGDEVGKALASNPRTAIGMIEPGRYVFAVSDGRTAESAGLSLSQLAEVLQSVGVQTAYNLDGGGSSTMIFKGNLINNPTTHGTTIEERSVSDIVYIG